MKIFFLLLLLPLVFLPCAYASAEDDSPEGQMDALVAERDAAIARVSQIVNQKIMHIRRYPDMRVAVSKSGWFDEGAKKPDFNKVDIRATQQFPYSKYDYVTSNLNPGIVFMSKELEFNPMTKYFYKDFSLPKKRLSQQEMLEINSLYRIIGRDEEEIAQLKNAPITLDYLMRSRYFKLAIEVLGLCAVFFVLYRRLYARR